MEASGSTERHQTSTDDSAWKDITVTGNLEIQAKQEGENPPLCCTVFPLLKEIAVGWSDGKIEVRDTATFSVQRTLEGPESVPVTCISTDESDRSKPKLLASYASGHTILWDATQGEKLLTIKEDRQTLVNTFNQDSASFAVGGSDAKIQIYDTESGEQQQVLQGTLDPETMDGHTSRVFSLRFHPSNYNDLLSGGWDDTVQFWDVRYPYSRRKIHGPHICNPNAIEFLGEDQFLTASWRKRKPLQVWEYETGLLVETVKPDNDNCFLYCCRYLEPEGLLLVGGSHKNMVRVVDIHTKMTMGSVRSLKGAVYFAKELPKTDEASSMRDFCFCSENSIYIAQIDLS